MIPGQTQASSLPTGVTLAKRLRKHTWFQAGVSYKTASALGSRGQALLCPLQLFSEILQGISYIFLGQGVDSTLDHSELSVQKQRLTTNKGTCKGGHFRRREMLSRNLHGCDSK